MEHNINSESNEDEDTEIYAYFKSATEVDPHMKKIVKVKLNSPNNFNQAKEFFLSAGTWIVETRFKDYFPHWEGKQKGQ